ncbi:MAG TPA: helix-turn-helix domain-containing protein [Candidatus Peribacteraceae bacterium]|nr:helix-turn-helix domain-containing protein [Candidatus Peribacteraceae bacterium]
MTDSVHDLLTSIGLSEKESAMYVALLRCGTQATSFLAERTHFNRGTAYVILHSLLKKGLATKMTKRSVQYFSPVQPEHLVLYLESREQEIVRGKERVQAMMGRLTAIVNPHTSQPKIEYFSGRGGARVVLENTLTSKDNTLRAFLSIADIIEGLGGDYFYDYTNRRIAKRYALQAIRTREKDKEAFEKDEHAHRYLTNPEEKREVRYVSEDLAFPLTMYMYDDKLAIISSKEENYSLLIESAELAEMQKKLFSLLWGTAQKSPVV